MLVMLGLIILAVWAYRRSERAERDRDRRRALRYWIDRESRAHPWERDEPWPGMEQSHRPTWTRRLRLVVKDTWAKEQPRRVFRFRGR